MIKSAISLVALGFASFAVPSLAQEAQAESSIDPDKVIIITPQNEREVVEEMGKAIVRPSRVGKPVARFDSPLCVKVSGMPDEMAELVAGRIRDNARAIRGMKIADEGCDPNAFVGVLNDVNETVDKLREDEPWLFEGLLSFQVDRIYKGSKAARAWHVFDVRNLDGSIIPGKQRGASDGKSIASAVNRVEKSSRISQLRTNLTGGVVLIETAALEGKTFRQLADYATIRLLASVSDEIDVNEYTLPTILTLFGSDSDLYKPEGLTEFDQAYLQALYELPANSRDGQIIAAAVSRYAKKMDAPLDE